MSNNNSNIKLSLDRLNEMKPLEVVKDEVVKARFIQIFDTIWGDGKGAAAYDKESVYYNRILSDNETLRKCTSFSIYTAFIDLAVCGLSLEPGAKALCYLQPRNYQTGVDPSGRKTYETRVCLTISGYGELVLRMRCGQIQHATNPVFVYAEDEFSFSDRDGRKSVNYTCRLPHSSGHIVAAFLRITLPNGDYDYGVMFEEDWLRLQDYSAKNNRKWVKDENGNGHYEYEANSLYTANEGRIDAGFLGAKLIKHAFKTYPKVKIGKSTELASEHEEPSVPEKDIYGVGDAPAQTQAPEPEPFGGKPDMSGGVQVNAEDDGTF